MESRWKTVSRTAVLLLLSILMLSHGVMQPSAGAVEDGMCMEQGLCWADSSLGEPLLVAWNHEPAGTGHAGALFHAPWLDGDAGTPNGDGPPRHYHWKVDMGDPLQPSFPSGPPKLWASGGPAGMLLLPWRSSSSSGGAYAQGGSGGGPSGVPAGEEPDDDDPEADGDPDGRAPVPEPGAALLFAAGALLIALRLRSSTQSASA